MSRPIASGLAFIVILFGVSFAQQPGGPVPITPTPAWVRQVAFEAPAATDSVPHGAGSEFLLVDDQFDVATMSSYFHAVTRILDVATFEEGQNLRIEFDPSYQHPDMHYARLLRAGETIDLLRRQKFRVIQREENLESAMYDARLTALLLMEDLRNGDTLEYAYTLRGQNPVFGGKYMESVAWSYGVPVRKRHVSLRVPAGRRIAVWPGVPGLRMDRALHDGTVEYRWNGVNLPGVEEEDGAPAWYDPYREIVFSEFHTWAEVAQWAAGTYGAQAGHDGGLAPVVERLRREHPGEEEYAVAALRFVQDDIRYYGVEMGEDSHRPTPPSEVLRQRFGDCKDKALLLCSLLGAASIRAEPVLVDTYSGEHLDPARPWPLAFDHVVVRITLQGREYFVDPTVTFQRGGLGDRCIAAGAKGLVVSGGTDTLVAIPAGCGKGPSTQFEERYSFSGTDSAVVDVTTTYRGADADDVRAYLAQRTAAELERSGRHFYADEFEGVRTLQPLRVTRDDSVENVVVVSERYAVDSFWVPSVSAGGPGATIRATTMLDVIGEAPASDRKAPLDLPHPVSVSCRITVEFPEPRDVDEESAGVDDPAFRFRSRISRDGNAVTMEYEYASLKDWVSPAELKAYAADVARARALVGVTFPRGPSGAFDSALLLRAGALALLLLTSGIVVRRLLRRAGSRSR